MAIQRIRHLDEGDSRIFAAVPGKMQMSTQGMISRRTLIKKMALFSAASGMLLTLADTAEAKASKSAVHYQDYPQGMKMCHMCKFYISAGGDRSGMGCGMMRGGMMGHGMMMAGTCEVVEGEISPMGYCDLYVLRA